jgi:CheY-like chemotaxis protein
MQSTIECQNYPNTVRDHVLGQLPAEAADRFEEHLFLCDGCRSAVAHLEAAVTNLSSFLTIHPLHKSADSRGCIPQVVVIEDNLSDIALIQRTLREHSADTNVTVANDGEEAIQLLGSMAKAGFEPDLILLDLNLPNRDGHEVLAFLRSNPQLRATPVAIFTSSDRPGDVQKAYSMGADCYVLKGNDLDSFTESVTAICSFWSSAGTFMPAISRQETC